MLISLRNLNLVLLGIHLLRFECIIRIPFSFELVLDEIQIINLFVGVAVHQINNGTRHVYPMECRWIGNPTDQHTLHRADSRKWRVECRQNCPLDHKAPTYMWQSNEMRYIVLSRFWSSFLRHSAASSSSGNDMMHAQLKNAMNINCGPLSCVIKLSQLPAAAKPNPIPQQHPCSGDATQK